MKGLLVDSNVLLDVFEDDPVWAPWSQEMLDQFSITHALCINPIELNRFAAASCPFAQSSLVALIKASLPVSGSSA